MLSHNTQRLGSHLTPQLGRADHLNASTPLEHPALHFKQCGCRKLQGQAPVAVNLDALLRVPGPFKHPGRRQGR